MLETLSEYAAIFWSYRLSRTLQRARPPRPPDLHLFAFPGKAKAVAKAVVAVAAPDACRCLLCRPRCRTRPMTKTCRCVSWWSGIRSEHPSDQREVVGVHPRLHQAQAPRCRKAHQYHCRVHGPWRCKVHRHWHRRELRYCHCRLHRCHCKVLRERKTRHWHYRVLPHLQHRPPHWHYLAVLRTRLRHRWRSLNFKVPAVRGVVTTHVLLDKQ